MRFDKSIYVGFWIPAYAGMTKWVVAVPPFDKLRANVPGILIRSC